MSILRLPTQRCSIFAYKNHRTRKTGSPPFSEDEIQGLFQDFQGHFFSIFKDLATGKIFENHLTFILKLKERNAIRKKMKSEKMKLEKINIWAIILGLVIILQLLPAY
jgi:hypothetical protein